MDAYSLITVDSRYTVPTVILIMARSEAHAREQALERLCESDFHNAVEVCAADLVLWKVTREDLDDRSATEGKSIHHQALSSGFKGSTKAP